MKTDLADRVEAAYSDCRAARTLSEDLPATSALIALMPEVIAALREASEFVAVPRVEG